MKIVVDMNLSPDWVPVLRAAGHEAEHWSTIGNPRAPDKEIMAWARTRGVVVFTHDLDFGTLLAATGAEGPSVFQIRTQDVTPSAQQKAVLAALARFKTLLEEGALITLDEARSRVRVLPLT